MCTLNVLCFRALGLLALNCNSVTNNKLNVCLENCGLWIEPQFKATKFAKRLQKSMLQTSSFGSEHLGTSWPLWYSKNCCNI